MKLYDIRIHVLRGHEGGSPAGGFEDMPRIEEIVGTAYGTTGGEAVRNFLEDRGITSHVGFSFELAKAKVA